MPLAWESEDALRRERKPARAPEPEPQRRDRAAALLALQRGGGNRPTAALIQRWKARDDLGPEYVQFDESEKQPNLRGQLAGDDGYEYKRAFNLDERVYKRTPKQGNLGAIKLQDPTEVAKERKLKEITQAKETLFKADQGGATEGSFEYVANYLFAEVFKSDPTAAQELWNEIWEAQTPQGGDPVATRKAVDQGKFIQKLIDKGLDATWQKLPVQELVNVAIKAKGGDKKPASSMPVVAWEMSDYLSALYNWAPWPENSGVGFHTTDGAPGAVSKPKAQGGWGGITRPVTVDFFKRRYGLDQGWNPLKGWIDRNGPTFRKGIKDNELLSTVSVATAIHGSVRFPLADTPGRKGQRVSYKGEDHFKMEVYIYAVRVGGGFATFQKQGAENAFGEIATGDIPIEDIIGWSQITRYHPYAKDTGLPLTIGFDYELSNLTRNPEFPTGGIYERVFVQAVNEIGKEQAKTSKPYE